MTEPVPDRRGLWRWLAAAVSVALLVAALVAISRSGVSLSTTRRLVASASTGLVIAGVALPLLNLTISAGVFWVLTRRFGRVGFGEMWALIGAAWLLNYLPMRPGLVGRVAYHRAVNGISVAHGSRVVAESVACSAAASLGAVGWSVLGARWPQMGAWIDAVPFALLAAGAAVAFGVGRKSPTVAALAAAMSLRIADLIVWTFRYVVVFAIAGEPISTPQAAAIAAVSQVAMSVPLVGNGLGLREWAVGLMRSSLPAWYGVGAASAAGLTADLLNRSAELCVAVPVGLACAAFVTRKIRAAGGGGRLLPVPPDRSPTPN
ncbi:MAG: hypothetical protein ACOYN0_16100 [Phycisphaerales bacterium]